MPYQSQRRNIVPGFELDADLEQGFHDAVKGSQPNMALRYAEEIIKKMQADIADLKRQVAELSNKSAAPKPTTPKPAPKKEEETV